MPTEAEIKKAIIDGTEKHFPGVHLFRVLCGTIRLPKRVIVGAKNGTPDLFGWLPDGRAFGVEVKTKVGTFSREQYELIGKAAKAGAVIITASSWEDYAHQVHGLCHEAELKDTKRYEEIAKS
jgi:hypothetical protein